MLCSVFTLFSLKTLPVMVYFSSLDEIFTTASNRLWRRWQWLWYGDFLFWLWCWVIVWRWCPAAVVVVIVVVLTWLYDYTLHYTTTHTQKIQQNPGFGEATQIMSWTYVCGEGGGLVVRLSVFNADVVNVSTINCESDFCDVSILPYFDVLFSCCFIHPHKKYEDITSSHQAKKNNVKLRVLRRNENKYYDGHINRRTKAKSEGIDEIHKMMIFWCIVWLAGVCSKNWSHNNSHHHSVCWCCSATTILTLVTRHTMMIPFLLLA